jgi:hypothetical protein
MKSVPNGDDRPTPVRPDNWKELSDEEEEDCFQN